MATIGERLRAERERIGMSQAEFAEAGGVQRRTQVYYEQDARAPDGKYLAAVASLGVDVAYVVTGRRTENYAAVAAPSIGTASPPPAYYLSERERVMLDLFREIDDAGRDGVQAAAENAKRVSEMRAELDELKKQAQLPTGTIGKLPT